MLLSIYVFSCTQTILKNLIPLFVVPKLRKKIHLKRNILTNKGKNLFKLTKNKEKISITWYFPLLFYKKVVIYVSTFIFLLGKYSAVLHYIPLFENECSNYTFPSICPSWKNVSQKYAEKRPSENSMRYHPDTLWQTVPT